MNTEKLNEYIFASLMAEQAKSSRRARQRAMEAEGASHDDVVNIPITLDDLRKGFERLEWYRIESLKVQQESLATSPK